MLLYTTCILNFTTHYNFAITVIYLSSQEDVFLKILLTKIVFSEVKKKEDDLQTFGWNILVTR